MKPEIRALVVSPETLYVYWISNDDRAVRVCDHTGLPERPADRWVTAEPGESAVWVHGLAPGHIYGVYAEAEGKPALAAAWVQTPWRGEGVPPEVAGPEEYVRS